MPPPAVNGFWFEAETWSHRCHFATLRRSPPRKAAAPPPPRLVAQRSLGSEPARADKHRRVRQTAAGLPCAPPGEQAAAAWRLCSALPRLCSGRSLGHRCGRADAHAFRSIAHLTLCPSGLRGWTQVPLARAAWAQIPQVSLCYTEAITAEEGRSPPGGAALPLFTASQG